MRGRSDATDTAGDFFSHQRPPARGGKVVSSAADPDVLSVGDAGRGELLSQDARVHHGAFSPVERAFPVEDAQGAMLRADQKYLGRSRPGRYGAGVPAACGGIVRLWSGWLEAACDRRQ